MNFHDLNRLTLKYDMTIEILTKPVSSAIVPGANNTRTLFPTFLRRLTGAGGRGGPRGMGGGGRNARNVAPPPQVEFNVY